MPELAKALIGGARYLGSSVPRRPRLRSRSRFPAIEEPALQWTCAFHAAAAPQAMDQAAAALQQHWAAHDNVPAHIRLQVGLAVAEIVANTVEHGSAGRHLVQIQMQVRVGAHQVLVALLDDGNPFEFNGSDAVMMPDVFAERGRGLAMAQRALESLSCRNEAGTNHWLLASRCY